MQDSRRVIQKQFTLGDAAVDGLLSGIAGGAVMAAFLVVTGLATGEGLAAILAHFDPGPTADPLRGAVMHLAASAVYGALFGLLWRTVSRGGQNPALAIFSGLIYGGVLFMVAERIIIPAGPSGLLAIPAWSLGLAHVIYGMSLGLLVARFAG